jgi:deoxyribodipyrimidine photo-lyase
MDSEKKPLIVWFRRDLRLADNPALREAQQCGVPIVAVYIHAPEEAGKWPEGGASRWWLHHALADLDGQLRKLGGRLILRRGPSLEALRHLLRETGASGVLWNRRYEPLAMARDSRIKASLRAAEVRADSFNGLLLHEPVNIATLGGKPYRVYTPFYKSLLKRPVPPPAQVDESALTFACADLASEPLEALELLPRVAWDSGLAKFWDPTRAGALERLRGFRLNRVRNYGENRNFPGVDGTSRLSPYLHFGQIGAREVMHAVPGSVDGEEKFRSEIYWREFAYNILYHFPHTLEQPLNANFARFPWRQDVVALDAWQRGQTGYPIVDAAMRQLWQTGWMHNRLRMIVASFLVKHLLISWEHGMAWFWDTLVDADLASNTFGWQWAGGCGADAAPYFRIFNPVNQGESFDADGDFTRHYCPEIAGLPDKFLFRPWDAPLEVLRLAKVRLGNDYPHPIVDNQKGRTRALAAYNAIKKTA